MLINIALALVVAAAALGSCTAELSDNVRAQPPDNVADALDEWDHVSNPRLWWGNLGMDAQRDLCNWLGERGALDSNDPPTSIGHALGHRTHGLTRDHLRLTVHVCNGNRPSEWSP